MSKKMNLIMENWRRFVNEAADPEKIPDDKFPLLLSAVKDEVAKSLVAAGEDSKDKGNQDDVVAVASAPFTCQELMPSQTSMNIHKAWKFALNMMNGTMFGEGNKGGPGGDLGAFISKDKYIMDGHHRWIATGMVNPQATITGMVVQLPGKKLVAVLNTITKGLHGVQKGNEATGGFEQFKTAEGLKKGLEDQMNGRAGNEQCGTGKDKIKPEMIKDIITRWSGEKDPNKVVDATVQKVLNLVAPLANKQIMPGAPSREDMPVIDADKSKHGKEAINTTVNALKGGTVDLNPPFASAAPAPAVQKESLKKIVRQVIRENLKRR